MAGAEIASLVLMLGSIGLATGLIVATRASAGKIMVALVAGVTVALLNFGIEALGARGRIYFVHGLWPIAHSALSLTIGWIFFTSSFALGSELIGSGPKPGIRLALYICAGIIAGIFSDYLGQIWTGHFALGAKGSWFYILLVWSSLTPLSLLIFRLLSPKPG